MRSFFQSSSGAVRSGGGMANGDLRPPFRVYFDHHLAGMWIHLPGMLAFFLIITGFFAGDAAVMLLSLLPMGVAFYHRPLISEMPQMEISADGLFLDGLGLICWEDILSVELDEMIIGGRPHAELLIETADTVEAVLEDQKGLTLARSLQVMIWRLEDMNELTVKLTRLRVDTGDLMAEIRHRRFHR
jgi:hypothetical protein